MYFILQGFEFLLPFKLVLLVVCPAKTWLSFEEIEPISLEDHFLALNLTVRILEELTATFRYRIYTLKRQVEVLESIVRFNNTTIDASPLCTNQVATLVWWSLPRTPPKLYWAFTARPTNTSLLTETPLTAQHIGSSLGDRTIWELGLHLKKWAPLFDSSVHK